MKTIHNINKLISNLYKKSNAKQTSIKPLTETSVNKDPVDQFCIWFKQAVAAEIAKPYEMALATASPVAKPSIRMVLLKNIDASGFTFFSNYKSRKGKELAENNNAAILFYWPEINRQVRIEGTVTKISPVESDIYFQSRPKESQISACISSQSSIISRRAELEDKWESFQKQTNGVINRPLSWGGYQLKPTSFEFWQYRPHRLHDRIVYTLWDSKWKIHRLAP